MIKTAKLSPRRGFRPVNAALYYGMRLVPYAGLRRPIAAMLARYIAARERIRSREGSVGAPAGRSDPVLASLRENGCAWLPPLLSQSQIDDVLTFLEGKKIIGGGQSFLKTEVPDDVLRAGYSLVDLLVCPHVLSVMNNPGVLRLAREYLGCPPTISGIGLHWTFPSTRSAVDVQCFHRDPDDWRFLKLFIYLTDVDDESGPHGFVAGSHLTSGCILSRPYGDEQLRRRYGDQRMLKIIGPKGTDFIADTWGVHKGDMPIARPRLLLQIQYSILPVMKFEYEPVRAPNAEQFNRYTNRLVLA